MNRGHEICLPSKVIGTMLGEHAQTHCETEALDWPQKVNFLTEGTPGVRNRLETEIDERSRKEGQASSNARRKMPVSAQSEARYCMPLRSLSQAVFHLAG